MRRLHVSSVLVSALLLFACSDDSATNKAGTPEEKTPVENPNPTCDTSCPKEASCVDEATLKRCQINADTGCVEWGEEPCPADTSCQDGVCKSSQTDPPQCDTSCPQEASCVDESTLKRCQINADTGCAEWEETPCPADTICNDGVCVPADPLSCDACPAGSQCIDEHSYKKCEPNQDNGCLQWSDPISCNENEICQDGQCVISEVPVSCPDACTQNEACGENNSYKECKDTDGDGCKELVEVSCDSAQTCSESACVCKKFNDEAPSMIHLLSDEGKGKSESTTVNDGFHDEYLYHTSEKFKIGVRQEWGGSIIFWGQADGKPGMNSTNTIDANDTGREVQVAVYDLARLRQYCAATASCWIDGHGYNDEMMCSTGIRHLGWNPVQGGNYCNIGSGIESVSNKDGILEIVTVPLQWNPDWDNGDPNACGLSLEQICADGSKKNKRSDVRLTQRIRFINSLTAELYYRVDNIGELDHRENVQEFPTLYSAYGGHGLDDYGTLMTANNKKVTPESNTVFKTEEPWVAFVNSSKTYGVGLLYENGVLEFSGEYHPKSYNVVRSRVNFGLPKNGSVSSRVYLFLGNYDTIADQVAKIQKRLPPFGALDTPDGKDAVSGDVKISGWTLDNKTVKKVVARIDETKEVELKYGEERSDVCLEWVGYANCKKSGFSSTISFAGYTNQCDHLIEIIATDDDNNERTIARRLVKVK
ncbi:MAG: hypothetical protein J6A01_03750 [Proteobacteria bacterium]|nr:hypothetical protein [Pseudomonadota bacterium]